MDGDGIEEKILTTQDCIDAYAWYVDQVTRRYEAEHFENILLDGWFWNNESASRADRDDEEVFAKGCMDELHKRGYKCIFIPYFQAGGCEKVDKIGFDVTTMQPGLSFQDVLGKDPQGMMQDFTDLCKKYGFGIELEIHHGVKNEETKLKYGQLFDEYLIGCIRNGMMTDTVHTYYQVAGPGVFHFCAHSKDNYQRAIYDNLYKFIKGTLTEADVKAKLAYISEPKNTTTESACEESVAEEPEPAKTEETTENFFEFTEEAQEQTAIEMPIEIPMEIEPEEEIKFELEPELAPEIEIEPESEIEFEEEPENEPRKKIDLKKINYKKLALIGAGIAATCGLIYLICKDKKK